MKISTWCASKGPSTALGWEVKPSYRTNGPRRFDHSIYDKQTGGKPSTLYVYPVALVLDADIIGILFPLLSFFSFTRNLNLVVHKNSDRQTRRLCNRKFSGERKMKAN